jgi:hypothetical protein
MSVQQIHFDSPAHGLIDSLDDRHLRFTQQEGQAMKRVALLLVLVVAVGTGCSHTDEVAENTMEGGVRHGHPHLFQFQHQHYTPDMTVGERDRQVARAWDWEGKQFADDVDTVLLLRPMSRLTKWNLR